jgi:glucosamine--fructose-6-phosphate aminotransferase (isomerizing)
MLKAKSRKGSKIMCGIIGILGIESTSQRLLEGLKRLEYRGYDSAGLVVINGNGFERHRRPGKLINLENALQETPIDGKVGIAHIRWATHGGPTEENAHPHIADGIAIVHNGIIENHQQLRQQALSYGCVFSSETDSEVVAQLIAYAIKQGHSPEEAAFSVFSQLEGAYAIAVLFEQFPDLLIGTRKSAPLVVGESGQELFLGSDALALSRLATRISYLEDGDVVILKSGKATFYNQSLQVVARPSQPNMSVFEHTHKGPYAHFMLKEIYEQPEVLQKTLAQYLAPQKDRVIMPSFQLDLATVSKVTIVACGTSYYAGLVAKYWLEQMAKIPTEVDIASEFRYRTPPLPEKGLAIFISQSGETADTLAAHAYAKSQGQYCLGIVNVPQSSLARAVDISLLTQAGPEIGVASTKAFTTQLSVLACLTLAFAQAKSTLSSQQVAEHCQALNTLPSLLEMALAKAKPCLKIGQSLAKAKDVLYLGRGTSYAIALEGALKLKEITYIHAEGYASGEMKHGPIALIDATVPIVVIAPSDALYEKTMSNLQEAAARDAQIILISDAAGQKGYTGQTLARLEMPTTTSFVSPIIAVIPVQLLAYYTALAKGTDVDQPRNLAKSVTVE